MRGEHSEKRDLRRLDLLPEKNHPIGIARRNLSAWSKRRGPDSFTRIQSTVAAQTISRTRRIPPSPPLLGSWNGVL